MMHRIGIAGSIVACCFVGGSATHATQRFAAVPPQPLGVTLLPRSIVVTVAADAVAVAPAREALVRYAVLGAPLSNVFTTGTVNAPRNDVQILSIEHAIWRLEEGGVPAAEITARRIRPFDYNGAPQAAVGILSVRMHDPRAATVAHVYEIMASYDPNVQYLDTLNKPPNCAQLLREAKLRAIVNAKSSAAELLTDFGLRGTRFHVLQARNAPPSATYVPDVSDQQPLWCHALHASIPLATDSAVNPPIPAVSQARAQATVGVDGVALMSQRTHAPLAQDFIEVADPFGGTTTGLPLRVRVDRRMRAAAFGAKSTVALRRADAWLIRFSTNFQTPEALRTFMNDLGTSAKDVTMRASPSEYTPQVFVRVVHATRGEVSALIARLHERAEQAKVSIRGLHVVEFAVSCNAVSKAALVRSGELARSSAERFARATGTRLGSLIGIVAGPTLTSIRCGMVPPTVNALADAIAPAPASYEDLPNMFGSVTASIDVIYALR